MHRLECIVSPRVFLARLRAPEDRIFDTVGAKQDDDADAPPGMAALPASRETGLTAAGPVCYP